ncbi:MAG: PocR ligand-binding domain-containing protein, partial [Vallitaleaceae bacterium]|nr:PocR ligand-binding domain-containing protein [Vallitaleaceae bacterium]
MNSKKSIQDYTFSEIFDLVEIQKLQDMFSLATGVATIITEPSGTPITKPSGFCGFCMNVVRETEKGLKNCMYSDSVIGSPFEDGPRIQRCLSGGLLDGGISIIVEGKHVANWLLGQVIDDEIAIENILPYAKEIGADQTIFIDELQKVKRMSREQFANICSLLELYVQQLSKYAIHNVALTKEIYQKNLDEIVLVELHNDKLKEMNTQLEEMNSELEELNAETEETNALLEEEVSERKKAEVTIRELNQGLEKQVLERTFQLEELNAVLEEEIAERIKSEELVIQEINFTKAIFESIPGMLYVYNAEGRLVRWNKQHEEMTGYCAEELAGMALADWYTSDEYIRVAAAVEDVFRNGHGGVEATLNIKNGKKLYVRMTGIPLDYNGQTYFTGVGIDIAEEKQSQKMLIDSDARHKEMIANISDVIAVIDNDGINQYKSPNVTKWFGWRCDELVGHSYIKTAHIEDQAYIKEVFRRILLKDDNVETVEYRYLCKDGSYKNIKLTAINLVHNKLINGILVNYHD